MHETEDQEQRIIRRNRVLKGGTIAYAGRHATLKCVVRDLSDSGARLQVENIADVPDTFELIIELDGFEAHCQVTRRHSNEVGVIFLAAPEKNPPKRAQTVIDPDSRASLRRRSVGKGDGAVQKPVPPNGAIKNEKEIPILIAEDDPDDRMLIVDAFGASNFNHPISFVENGAELLRYVRAQEPYCDRVLPGLILLDLNMPKMDGRTALMNLKTDSQLKRIPVIVMTTSQAEEDIRRTYDLGVTAYIAKPRTYQGLLEVVDSLNRFWARHVCLPTN